MAKCNICLCLNGYCGVPQAANKQYLGALT